MSTPYETENSVDLNEIEAAGLDISSPVPARIVPASTFEQEQSLEIADFQLPTNLYPKITNNPFEHGSIYASSGSSREEDPALPQQQSPVNQKIKQAQMYPQESDESGPSVYEIPRAKYASSANVNIQMAIPSTTPENNNMNSQKRSFKSNRPLPPIPQENGELTGMIFF